MVVTVLKNKLNTVYQKHLTLLNREDIEKLLGNRIYLDLWVKVKDDWRNRDGCLKSLGYDE